MIPTPQSTKSSKLMNSLWLRTSVRTGLTKNSSLTTKNVMARRSTRSADARSVTSLTPAPARVVMRQNRSSTRITVPKDSSCARSAMPGFHQMKAGSLLWSCAAPTVATPWALGELIGINICNFQGSFEPFSLALFFHNLFDTTQVLLFYNEWLFYERMSFFSSVFILFLYRTNPLMW